MLQESQESWAVGYVRGSPVDYKYRPARYPSHALPEKAGKVIPIPEHDAKMAGRWLDGLYAKTDDRARLFTEKLDEATKAGVFGPNEFLPAKTYTLPSGTSFDVPPQSVSDFSWVLKTHFYNMETAKKFGYHYEAAWWGEIAPGRVGSLDDAIRLAGLGAYL